MTQKSLIQIPTTTFLLVALLTISAYSHTSDGEPKCAHNRLGDVPDLLDVQEEFLSNQTRVLATSSYPQIRMTADYSVLTGGDSDFKTYVQSKLMPAVLDYFKAALMIKQPLTSNLKLSTSYKTICSYTTPQALLTGVATDFYLIVASNEDDENWVASAGSCLISSSTKRPLVAK